MKNKLLTLMVVFGCGFANISEAQFKMKNPLGALTGDSEKQSNGDISAIQEALLLDLTDALGDVLAAQAIIAEAQGNKELAATLNNTSDKMKGGDASNDDIQGGLSLSSDTVAAQQSVINEGESINSESKALYAKALKPYVKSVAKTAKLSQPIEDFMNEAQNSLKSIKNPMEIRKLKKTLDTGLFIGRNTPKLIVNLGKSSKDLLSFAKKNDLDTSGADDIELDM
tara:strand:- start:1144 stop:1821 length:678 start_codon:yes stop_codon:yes gene_type:complete